MGSIWRLCVLGRRSKDAGRQSTLGVPRGGFLGITSLGWSTLVQIVEANETDREGVVSMLAQRLIESFGAPEPATARAAAEEEVAFLQSLCDQPQDTLVAIHRVSENGSIRGPFRTLRPRDRSQPLRAFTFLDVEEEEPHHALDDISLAALAGKESR